jgi:hypothetical protein
MLILAGILIGFGIAASIVLVTEGILEAVERRWKRGMLRVAAGASLAAASVAVLGLAARLFIPPEVWVGGEVEEKARALAENIAQLMNISVLGLPLGLIAAGVVVWRRRSARNAASERRP